MTMPEAAVNKNHLAMASKQHIGAAGQLRLMQPIPIPHGMNQPSNDHLGLRVCLADALHPLCQAEPYLLHVESFIILPRRHISYFGAAAAFIAYLSRVLRRTWVAELPTGCQYRGILSRPAQQQVKLVAVPPQPNSSIPGLTAVPRMISWPLAFWVRTYSDCGRTSIEIAAAFSVFRFCPGWQHHHVRLWFPQWTGRLVSWKHRSALGQRRRAVPGTPSSMSRC